MFRIEKICENISSNIAQELNLDYDKKSVINYGIFSFIQMSISVLFVMIVGAIFNVFIESLIISFTTSILRKSSGGAHASTPMKCSIIGTISSVGMGLISKYYITNFYINILIGIATFVLSYYILYKLAPVDSVAKPIKNFEKRKRLKKHSIMILSFYLILAIINFVYYFVQNSDVLVYSLCIYMGILLQVFSLTKIGHILLGKLDKLL